MTYILRNTRNAFYELYKSSAEYDDKQSVMRCLFKKLVNKGAYDFKSRRSKQAIYRFRNKVVF